MAHKIMNPEYLNMKLPSPEVFINKYPNSRVLLIGTGPSTQKLLKYRDQLKKKFDIIIGVNFAVKHFESELDFHVLAEKNATNCVFPEDSKTFSKTLTRVFNWKVISKYPKEMNFVKFTRNYFEGTPNIRSYKLSGISTEGLFIGPVGSDGLSLGTVLLQAMHLGAIMGAKSISIIGADLVFAETLDHYYDREYRDDKKFNRGPKRDIITIQHQGKVANTLNYFKESAQYLDKVINELFRPVGVEVYDFSDGLLIAPTKLDVDGFFGVQNDIC